MHSITIDYPLKKSLEDIKDLAVNRAKDIDLTENSLLIEGDNFDALSSLLKSGLNGKVDLIYIDPPYNTKQDFYISDERISTISRGKSTEIAYSDNMTAPEYLEFMRERLIILRELLSDNGTLYLHIDVKMGHYIKVVLDEIFGRSNFLNDISRIKSNPKNFQRRAFGNQKDVIYIYAKNAKKNIFNNITTKLDSEQIKKMFVKVDSDGRRYNTVPAHAPGETTSGVTGGEWKGMLPPAGRHWRTNPDELDRLDSNGLIEWSRNGIPRIKKYADEHNGKKIQDVWYYPDPAYPSYPTEKNLEMLEMIVRQSSNPESIVLDCFAGSGSTLMAAQNNGRRWIGIDQSKYSIKTIESRFSNHIYTKITL